MQRGPSGLRGWVIPVLALVLWELWSHAGTFPIDTLSRPSDIAVAGARGFIDGSIPLATWQTVQAALYGLAVAAEQSGDSLQPSVCWSTWIVLLHCTG